MSGHPGLTPAEKIATVVQIAKPPKSLAFPTTSKFPIWLTKVDKPSPKTL